MVAALLMEIVLDFGDGAMRKVPFCRFCGVNVHVNSPDVSYSNDSCSHDDVLVDDDAEDDGDS